MWTKTYSKQVTGVTRNDIWRMWTDVNKWPTWHDDLEHCKMEGAFEVGNHFILKPKGVRPFKIMLTAIEEGRSFTDCTHFLGAKMYDTHIVEETQEGILLTNRLVVTGLLQWVWVKLVAQNVASSAPEATDALIRVAGGHDA